MKATDLATGLFTAILTAGILIILSVVLLGACGAPDTELNVRPIDNQTEFGGTTDGMVYTNRVSEVRLDDGTRCVILEVYKGGGIDCDW